MVLVPAPRLLARCSPLPATRYQLFSLSVYYQHVPPHQKHLSLDEIYHPDKKLDLEGKPLEGLKWLDEEHYLQPGPSDSVPAPRKVNVRTGESCPLYDSASLEEALEQAPGLAGEDARKLARGTGHRINAVQTAVLLEHESTLFLWCLDSSSANRLAEGFDKEVGAEFSPDGQSVSFIRANNICVVDIKTGTERALTTEGRPDLLMGRLDWVYQEELYGRGKFQAYWWNPDSTQIAFLCLDESQVPARTLVDHVTSPQDQEIVRYPRAGEPNPTVRLGLIDAGGGSIRWIDTSRYDSLEHLIVQVSWTPNGDRIAYQVQDREQTWLDLNFVEACSGQTETVFRETARTWVSALGSPRWLTDGGFLWLSERTGWKHIYCYSRDHSTVSAITSGPWEVRELHGIDEEGGVVFFSGTRDSSLRTHAYRINLDGTNLKRLTREEGTHQTSFSPAFSHFIDSHNTLATPTRVRLHDRGGSVVRVIDDNPAPLLPEYKWGQTEFLEVETRDGFVMNALMIKPPRFRPDRQYPVLSYTYGGPMAQQVRDLWGGPTYLWHQMLAQMGYIVWICDNRTASSKGAESAWPVYRNFGELELQDLEDGVDWLRNQPYVDDKRIGIWGWSFGGYMTAYALTHSTSFKVGIAGAPVTDWSLYDTIYTERYMSTPQANPEGYKKSSVLRSAEHLSGKLLLLHGAMDDNVHLHHSVRFMHELQKAGKQFDFMLYPKSRHRIEDPAQLYHLRTLMTNFVLTHL